jgi:hypothetical protein
MRRPAQVDLGIIAATGNAVLNNQPICQSLACLELEIFNMCQLQYVLCQLEPGPVMAAVSR